MIAFRYTKTDGAEYLSHLDLLRHICRTFKRAGIELKYSEGFNPHPKIFMNNPLGLGIKSLAEYCAADCGFNGDFLSAFNDNSPKGVKCTAFKVLDVNPNYAYTIKSCSYTVDGIEKFDPGKFLSREKIIICDRRGREVDIRQRVYSLSVEGNKILFTLGCGENNLRPDLFAEYLEREFGGKAHGLIKISASGEYTF
ncbi:MAG: TIGR03936 family radical SAM-associated protein [Clostridia bacterium]|nr:TIGR03936 family radical SAM-associated protein [Clostridia bacterium]